MSVYYQSFVLYGWEIGIDEYEQYGPEPDEEWYENILEQEYSLRDANEGDVAVIVDGRSGEYCYFGIIVAATNSTRDGPQSFDDPNKLNETPSYDQQSELIKAVNQHAIRTVGEPTHHIFTHVT